MAADLSIHVMHEVTEEDLKVFFSNALGHKWCEFPATKTHENYREVLHRIAATPQVWIGEVSWLKAALFEDDDKFVPDTVGTIQERIDDGVTVIDEVLIHDVITAFSLENATQYRLADVDEVVKWLKEHIGEVAFTVSG